MLVHRRFIACISLLCPGALAQAGKQAESKGPEEIRALIGQACNRRHWEIPGYGRFRRFRSNTGATGPRQARRAIRKTFRESPSDRLFRMQKP
jgi:hypothetical protein